MIWQDIPSDVLMWALTAIVMVIIEVLTVGFFCLFFAIGAIITAFAAYGMPGDYTGQMFLFVGSSFLVLLIARPMMKKAFRVGEKPILDSNASALIDKAALVVEPIQRYQGKVKVVHTGEVWSAYLAADVPEAIEEIPAGHEVMIVQVDGAKLAVRQK